MFVEILTANIFEDLYILLHFVFNRFIPSQGVVTFFANKAFIYSTINMMVAQVMGPSEMTENKISIKASTIIH